MAQGTFADTQYWIAILHPHDQWAAVAVRYASAETIVTTDEVLIEVLGFVSGHGARSRSSVAAFCRSLVGHPQVQVIPQSRTTFLLGLDLYESRADKGYSLVDCISMVTMRSMGIEDVLTGDRHFEQEGFNRLLV